MLRSRSWAMTWTVLRLLVAAAILAAIAVQLTVTITNAVERGRDVGTTLANFFSFFTILSNFGAVIVLVWAALWFLTRRRRADVATLVQPRGLAVVLASVTTYMIITGIVYNALLRFVPLPIGSEPVPWSNEVMHLVAPLFLLADLFVAPARRALAPRTIWAIIAFPIVWVVYTLVRGPVVTDPTGAPPWWYPYPFLDPHAFDNGYVGVALYVVGIAAAIVAVGVGVLWVSRRAGERRRE